LRLHTDNRPTLEGSYDGRVESSAVLVAPPSADEEPPSFVSSVALLNEIDMLADVAFRSNWIGIQSDCPGRERLGYGGDMMTSAEAGIYMFGATSFYAKRAMDYADSRRPNYGLPETAPFVGINSCLTNPELGKGGLGGAGVAAMPWGATLPHTLHLLRIHADDNRTIAEHYPVAIGWLALLEAARAPDGTLHNALGMPGACNGTGEALMGTAFLFQQASLMAELAEVGGHPELKEHYTELANHTHAAFNRVFYNKTAGAYWDGLDTTYQSAQIYALGLGLVPEAEVPRVVAGLMQDVVAANNSFVVDAFSVWLMHCLVELGAGEEVMQWMMAETYPSYGYFIRNQMVTATAMMEHWTTPTDDSSHNHAWMNSVALFYRSRLVGIAPTGPGWSHVRVRPWLLGSANLTWARGVVDSVRGPVQSSWNLNPAGALTLNVSFPANINVAVHVPVIGLSAAENAVHTSCATAKQVGAPYSLGGKFFVEYDASFLGACTFNSLAAKPLGD
jgi:alpha-L-rhamnosidase